MNTQQSRASCVVRVGRRVNRKSLLPACRGSALSSASDQKQTPFQLNKQRVEKLQQLRGLGQLQQQGDEAKNKRARNLETSCPWLPLHGPGSEGARALVHGPGVGVGDPGMLLDLHPGGTSAGAGQLCCPLDRRGGGKPTAPKQNWVLAPTWWMAGSWGCEVRLASRLPPSFAPSPSG